MRHRVSGILVSMSNQASNIREKYKRRLNRLREIINRHDPIGLITGGAPEYEYDPEASSIIVGLIPGQSEEAMLGLVHGFFTRDFGDDGSAGPPDAYSTLTREISEWVNSSEF